MQCTSNSQKNFYEPMISLWGVLGRGKGAMPPKVQQSSAVARILKSL